MSVYVFIRNKFTEFGILCTLWDLLKRKGKFNKGLNIETNIVQTKDKGIEIVMPRLYSERLKKT